MSGDGEDNDFMNSLNRLVGNDTDEESSGLGQIDADVTKKSNNAKAGAEADDELDDITKNEIRSNIFREGAKTAAEAHAAARAGKGIYGIRRRNVQVAKFMADKPGASQINIANTGRPIGDTDMAGLPSLITDGDPIGTASLIQDAQMMEEKRRKRGDR